MPRLLSFSVLNSKVIDGTTTKDQDGFESTKFTDAFNKSTLENSTYKRSIARDGLLASLALKNCVQSLDQVTDKSKIGIYSAALNGPLLYNEYDKTKPSSKFYDLVKFKKIWPPKQHFRQNAPLRATHYSLLTKSQGPLVTMVDPRNGLIDAMNWAQMDLFDESVEVAIVLAAFSFEDIQVYKWYKKNSEKLHECAICLVLAKDDSKNLIELAHISQHTSLNYGICTPFFQQSFLDRLGILI